MRIIKPKQTTALAPIAFHKVGDVYICDKDYRAFIDRYKKWMFIAEGYPSNGANIVKDRCPTAFFLHDKGCNTGTWEDGTKMCNRELSFIYYDTLKYFGHDDVAWIKAWDGII